MFVIQPQQLLCQLQKLSLQAQQVALSPSWFRRLSEQISQGLPYKLYPAVHEEQAVELIGLAVHQYSWLHFTYLSSSTLTSLWDSVQVSLLAEHFVRDQCPLRTNQRMLCMQLHQKTCSSSQKMQSKTQSDFQQTRKATFVTEQGRELLVSSLPIHVSRLTLSVLQVAKFHMQGKDWSSTLLEYLRPIRNLSFLHSEQVSEVLLQFLYSAFQSSRMLALVRNLPVSQDQHFTNAFSFIYLQDARQKSWQVCSRVARNYGCFIIGKARIVFKRTQKFKSRLKQNTNISNNIKIQICTYFEDKFIFYYRFLLHTSIVQSMQIL
ncbi:hypothetical protein SS50377_20196 [Spironucleus salmonicida]|uniref:Uncharacterized protein n=1 Tax=Spironucleus salmonicida TaxID=348837 RepID=V6LNF8_9EUKA|nr:hypothetical protein SS50377_20196 [Spironucleus salmonicida]|eukprot:EST45251.1 Hypothetical protein SS50377_14827 [Spironucleus salmonicida]